MNEKCTKVTLFLANWTVLNITSITIDRDIYKTYPNGNRLLTEDDYPDVEVILGVTSLSGDTSGIYRNLLGLSDDFYKEVFSDYEGVSAFTLVPVLLRPKSRGRITLRSSNPLDPPIVDMNYYDDEADLKTMVQAIKIVCLYVYLYVTSIVIQYIFCF